jgi:prepilin-type N-terminal cleavage/methylation domain-containing protein
MPLNAGRRGFTLVELLVGLVLFGLIGGVMLHATLAIQRTVRAHLSRLDAEGALDAAMGFLGSELASLGRDTASSDLLQQAAESLSYRAERGTGLACQVTPGAVWLEIGRYAGARLPQPGRDSLLLYLGPDAVLGLPGSWVAVPIFAVQNGACGSGPAWKIVTLIDTTRVSLAWLPVRVPARVFEVMQARLYRSSGATWLGVRSVSAGEIIQPLAGPFTLARSGFILRDSAGSRTTSTTATRQIEIGLSGPWSGWKAGTGPAPEESTGVSLTPGNLHP